MSGTLPPTFDFSKLYFAQVQTPAPLSLEPLQWKPNSVLVGRTWVWNPGTSAARCWVLEADTQNLPRGWTWSATATSEVIQAETLEAARQAANRAAVAFMGTAFKRPDPNSPWPSLATWAQYGGHWDESP